MKFLSNNITSYFNNCFTWQLPLTLRKVAATTSWCCNDLFYCILDGGPLQIMIVFFLYFRKIIFLCSGYYVKAENLGSLRKNIYISIL